MARGKAHSPETKAAVIAALLGGLALTEVAATFKLPETTVSQWKSEIPTERFVEVRSKKRETLLSLVEGHLTASLKAATSIAEKCSTNDKWLGEQSASDLAILYGVLSDKSIRLVEAMQRAYQPQDAG